MCSIVEVLKSRNDVYILEGASELDIKQVEEELGVRFAPDYHELLAAFGVVSYKGHEIVGICSSPRLNVADVTKKERDRYTNTLDKMYVIERANIDSIVIWQSTNGEIYKTTMGSEPIKVCDSLVEFINLGLI